MWKLPRFRDFARNEKGLAALEFALIAPLMLTVLFGTIEVTEALATNRRVENTAASLADVVARDTSISDGEIDDLWDAADALMFPDDPTPLSIRITSVEIESDTVAKAVWSEVRGGDFPTLGVGDTVTVPAGMMAPGTSVIMTETSYRYVPPIGVTMDTTFYIKHREFRRPRIADPVTRDP